MRQKLSLKSFSRPHFIGVGGISMSGLAKACVDLKKTVSGSDTGDNDELKALKELGVMVYKGHNAQNVGSADLVIYSSAISNDNPELQYAIHKKIPVYKRSEFLDLILEDYKNVIAFCGSHGKTTATAMLSNIFINAKLNPSVFLGGEDSLFGNYKKGGKGFAIIEACEYKKNFLDLRHSVSVVLNVDNDHFDSFSGMDDMVDAFNRFIGDNLAIINADDEYSSKLFNGSTITFGIKKSAVFSAKNVKYNGEGYSFNAYYYANKLGKINLKIGGKHNVYNALSTIAVASLYGVDFSVIKSSLESFSGVKRRNEYIGDFENIKCICDYAHHPKEIDATLKVYEKERENLLVVFQPHTYSRTKILMDDFVNTLKNCKNLIIYKTYPAREKFCFVGSAQKLYENVLRENKDVKYACSKEELFSKIQEVKSNFTIDKMLFLGAGDIYFDAINFVLSSKTNDTKTQKKVYRI